MPAAYAGAMTSTERTTANLHAEYAAAFGRTIAAVTDWSDPTPVPEWTCAEVPAHLLGWLPTVLPGAGLELASHEDLPLDECWAARTADIQAILDDPELASRELTEGPFAGMTVERVLAQFYVPDVYMHTFDLARGAGVQPEMDPAHARELLAGLKSFPGLRESGQFGIEYATDSDDPVVQLMAYIGRDPHWSRS